jgi:hypothetical protein
LTRNKSCEHFIAEAQPIFFPAHLRFAWLQRGFDIFILLEKGKRRHHRKMAGARREKPD